ncbi:MAG: uroporphyrinogen-III synthase [Planctomycetota bacterium]
MSRPLRVLLTRDEGLADEVRAIGAEVRMAVVTRTEPVPVSVDPADHDWIVFTSRRAVAYWSPPLDAGPRIACVGPGTRQAVEERGGEVSLVPGRHDADALCEELARRHALTGARVLFPCAETALRTVEERLGRAGARVTRLVIYRTVPADALPEGIAEGVDVAVFLAPSAVEAYAVLGGDLLAVPALAIGPTTADALRARGVEPTVAPTSDRDGVLESLRSWRVPR